MFFFFQAEDGIRDIGVTGVQTCALPIWRVMLDAAATADIDPDRLSFTHALRVMQESLPGFQLVDRADLPRLYQRLVRDRKRVVLGKRVDLGGRRIIKKKITLKNNIKRQT